jgi:hypothetical protein
MAAVPNVPGVPILPSYSIEETTLLFSDAALVIARALQPQWGIYQNNQAIIASSVAAQLGLGSLLSAANSITSLFGFNATSNFSVVDFDYKQEWTVSTYPVEQGGFQSYDKVQLPFDVKMRVAAGGSQSNRQALLDTITSIANSITLYDVYTPEEFYANCSVTHVDYKRTAQNGVGLILADIWLMEIRNTSTTTYGNTSTPAIAGQQNSGSVGTTSPTSSQETGVASGLTADV